MLLSYDVNVLIFQKKSLSIFSSENNNPLGLNLHSLNLCLLPTIYVENLGNAGSPSTRGFLFWPSFISHAELALFAWLHLQNSKQFFTVKWVVKDQNYHYDKGITKFAVTWNKCILMSCCWVQEFPGAIMAFLKPRSKYPMSCFRICGVFQVL